MLEFLSNDLNLRKIFRTLKNSDNLKYYRSLCRMLLVNSKYSVVEKSFENILTADIAVVEQVGIRIMIDDFPEWAASWASRVINPNDRTISHNGNCIASIFVMSREGLIIFNSLFARSVSSFQNL